VVSRRRNVRKQERRQEREVRLATAADLMAASRAWAARAEALDRAGHCARARAAERLSVERAARASLVEMGVDHRAPLSDEAVALAMEAVTDLRLGDPAGADERRREWFRLLRKEVAA
jgi:hypothetical protein